MEVRPRVVVTHWVHPEVEEELAAFADHVVPTWDEAVWPPSRVAELAADADGLIVCMADAIDDAFLAGCPRLRVVSATLKGHDNLDAEACARRGVWLTVVPDTIIAPTAELAVGLLLAVMRRLVEGHDQVRQGRFAGWRPRLYGSGLGGATVGLVGMGQLGQAVARRLAGFGADLVYHDARRLPPVLERSLGATPLGLAELAERSDALVVALPLTGTTGRLIDADIIGRLRGGYLVNVGRGSVVDEEAVADALEGGQLAGYAADVFAMEDRSDPDHPAAVPARLLRHPRAVLTPHLGSAVDDVRRAMSLEAVRQVRQVLAGAVPDHPVNRPAP